MKSISIFAAVAFAIFVPSCVQKGAVGDATPSEKVTLARYRASQKNSSSNNNNKLLFAPLVGEAVLELGTAIVNAAGSALDDYAKKFGANYSATYVCASPLKNGDHFRFERVVHFKSDDASKPLLDSYHSNVEAKKKLQTLKFEFDVAMNDKAFRINPTKLIFRLPKANQLRAPLKNEAKILFITTIRWIEDGKDGPAIRSYSFVAPPIPAVPSDNYMEKWRIAPLASDWYPAPPKGTSTVSVVVTAMETGKGQGDIEKLAAELRKWGAKGVTELQKQIQ